MHPLVRHLPNALSFARIALTVGTYGFAWTGDRASFAVAVLVIVLTDMLDGPIARRTGTADEKGANLDSASDFLFYASLPVWAWLLAEDVVRAYLPLIVVLFVAYVAANVAARVRLGRLGFHNRFTRSAGTAGVTFALVVILWGSSVWFFQPLLWLLVTLMVLDLAQRAYHITRGPHALRGATAATPPGRPRE